MQTIFPGQDLVDRDLVDVALFDGVQRRTHLADRQRTVLLLLHQLGDALAAPELRTRRRVEVRGELRERLELTGLGKRQKASSEARPTRKECVRTRRFRWSPYHEHNTSTTQCICTLKSRTAT